MPLCRFEAVDPTGQPVSGQRQVASPEALVRELQRLGLMDIRVQPIDDRPPDISTGGTGRLSADDASELARQIAGLTSAGMPLDSGLTALAQDMPAGQLRRAVQELAEQLRGGTPLDDAIASLGDRFPSHLGGIVRAGVRSGHVGEVLSQFVEYSHIGVDLKRKLLLSLIYPLILVGCFLLLLFLICQFVVSDFDRIFEDFGIDLPGVSVALIQFGRLVTGMGWSFVATPIILALAAWVGVRYLLDPLSRRRIMASIPVLGQLWTWTSMAEFAHYLGMLLDCQIPLPRAVVLASEGTGDPQLLATAPEMARRIESGESLTLATANTAAVPPAFSRVLLWAESHQSFSESLHMVGQLFEAQARARANFVSSVVGILAVVLVLWGAAFVVFGLLLPLLQLLKALS